MASNRWSAHISDRVTQIVLDNRSNANVSRWNRKIDFGFKTGDCWVWLGALSDEGYGDFWLAGRTVRAHRIGYLWTFGEPPRETPLLDHINCVGRFCVNPHHLEPVTVAENTKRGQGYGASRQRMVRSNELELRQQRRASGEEEIFW